MKKIYRLELEKAIDEDKRINFLAFVQTPWHALGVDAFIRFKEESGIKLHGFVCILSHAQAGIILKESSFSFDLADIEIVHYTDGTKESPIVKIKNNLSISNTIKFLHKSGDDFFILSTVYPKYQWHAYIARNCQGRRPVSVLIDEGLGMYMRNMNDWIMETWSSKERLYKKLKYTYEFCFGSPQKEKWLKKKKEFVSFGLFNTVDMSLNNNVVEYYKKVLNNANKQINDVFVSCYENAIVINTQPYFDEGQLTEDSDINLIKHICLLCAKKGFSVVLKPHPREKNIERYDGIDNCVIDSNFTSSQESIISNLKIKPRLIVGLCSTTLVSLRLFYGIKTASVMHCISSKGMGKKMNNDLIKFEKVFGKTVPCPLNLEEFSELLNRI